MVKSDCGLCAIAKEADNDKLVYRDEHWIATNAADVPGWVMLNTLSHIEGPWSLSPEQAEGLGQLQQKLSAIIRKVTGAELVYLMSFGETSKHCHLLFMPRFDDTPEESRGLALLTKAAELANPEDALRITTLLRAEAMGKFVLAGQDARSFYGRP